MLNSYQQAQAVGKVGKRSEIDFVFLGKNIHFAVKDFFPIFSFLFCCYTILLLYKTIGVFFIYTARELIMHTTLEHYPKEKKSICIKLAAFT